MSGLNIYERLLKITEEAGKMPKSGWNDFNKYHYVQAVDVVEHVSQLLVKHKVHCTVSIEDSRRTQYGKNFHTEIDCEAIFINTDNPTDKHVVKCRGIGADTLDKDMAKANTSVLKRLFTTEFKIVTDDVQDIESQKKAEGENDNVARITDEQIINLRSLCEGFDMPIDETLKKLAKQVYQLKKIEDMPETFYEDAVKRINGKAKKP